MKNLFRVPFAFLLASLIIVSCSTDSVTDFSSASQASGDVKYENKTNAVPWPAVVAVIKIIADISDGRYSKVTKYENGQVSEVIESCKGAFGTCSISSSRSTNGTRGENVSLNPIHIDESETDAYTINAELQNTDQGILYAINYIEYPEDAERFFNTDLKIISGDFVIDNPEILEELGVDSSEPIVVTGEYEVFQTDMYKYIVINES